MAGSKKKHLAPSLIYTLLEFRWVAELAAHSILKPYLASLEKGDGHTVIVIPGFLASHVSTRPLRRCLSALNYNAVDWGLGRNLYFNDKVESELATLLRSEFESSQQKVSIIGWSLGGVFAREIARSLPQHVRNVISLGSPITGARHAALARPVFELINGLPDSERQRRIDNLHVPPPVPTTAIYSKTDGIVHWHGALQSTNAISENIRVHSSHLGMSSNPLVMYVLADRLAQAEDDWKPFSYDRYRKIFFRKPDALHTHLGDFF